MIANYTCPKVYYCPVEDLESPLSCLEIKSSSQSGNISSNDTTASNDSTLNITCIDQSLIVYSENKNLKHTDNSSNESLIKSDSSVDEMTSASALLEGSNDEDFKLEYPGTAAAAETFAFSSALRPKVIAESIKELQSTVNMILQYCIPPKSVESLFGSEYEGIWRQINKACNKKDISLLRRAVEEYNSTLRAHKRDFKLAKTKVPYPLIVHILEQAYSRTVAPYADLLRQYKGFSNNVYGEIKPVFVDHFLKKVNLKPGKVFLDMGSGIGNVVLQVAAQCQCEAHGIEIMERPAQLADKQRGEFISRMQYYGKSCGPITLLQGDFLENKHALDIVSRADVILVNNYAFDAALNHSILNLFLDLKDKTKVITLKNFVSTDRRSLNHRNMSDVVNIFKITEHYFPQDSVSWMSEGGKYYIHTVDRAWFANQVTQLGFESSSRRAS